MPTELTINDDLTATVQDVIDNHCPDLKQYVPEIVGIVKCKTDKDGTVVPCMIIPVILKKTPPVYIACGVPPYAVVADELFWQQAPAEEIKAMVYNALFDIELDVTDGGVRFKKRRPDVVVHHETVRKFGAFTASVAAIHDILKHSVGPSVRVISDRISSPRKGKSKDKPAEPPNEAAGAAEAAETPNQQEEGLPEPGS